MIWTKVSLLLGPLRGHEGLARGDPSTPPVRYDRRKEISGVWVKIRATKEQREAWRQKASNAGLTLSAMLRAALDEARPPRRRRIVTDPALLRGIARIGNNLNQLARWANRDRGGVDTMAMTARLVEIDRELVELRR